jgi:hypothetical protein
VFGVPPSTFYYRPGPGTPAVLAAALVALLRRVIDANRRMGCGGITAMVRWELQTAVN